MDCRKLVYGRKMSVRGLMILVAVLAISLAVLRPVGFRLPGGFGIMDSSRRWLVEYYRDDVFGYRCFVVFDDARSDSLPHVLVGISFPPFRCMTNYYIAYPRTRGENATVWIR